jgi:Family of unknown function (DUF5941)
MTAATTAPAQDQPALPRNEAVYRDDGPLSLALGRVLGRAPGLALLLVGTGGLLLLIAIAGGDASNGVAAAGVAWVILLNGASGGRWPRESFHWAVPPLVRLGEYATLLWLAEIAGGPEGAFALLCALTFRHYDLVYRPRYQGVAPPAWLQTVGGGWDGRLVLAFGLLAVDALPAGMFILAGALGATFVAECVMSWVRLSTRPVSVYEDEEDEGQ